MPVRTSVRLSCVLLAVAAGTRLSTLWATPAHAQGSAAPPAITGSDQTEYCVLGDLLTLNGTHFGLQGRRGHVIIGVPVADGSGGHVFQNYPLSIKDWSDTQIHARLFFPGGADLGTWVATVHRDDGQLASQTFVATNCWPRAEDQSDPAGHAPLPVSHGLQMTRFHSGDRLIIHGENFGAQPDGGYVSFVAAFQDAAGNLYYHEYPVSVEGWSNFRIQVPLFPPTGAVPGTWVATVHRSDGETASTEFTVIPQPPPPPPAAETPPQTENCLAAGDPLINGVQRLQYCASGDFLVIHGEQFCSDSDGGWVTLTAPYQDAAGHLFYQEVPAQVIGWLSTQIHVNFAAPPGAVPGTYTATVHVHRYNSAGNNVVKTASVNFNVVSCSGSGGGTASR